MATGLSLLLFSFLSLPLCFTNANAGRYFFNKMTRTDESNNPTEAFPTGSSIPEERNISTQFPSINQSSGYGLYGRDPKNFSPTTTDNTVDNSETIADEKLFNNQFDNTNDNPYKYSNNEFTRGRNVPNYDERNRQYDYGMSDTRFLENGKYYYDVNTRRYGYGSETSKPTRTDDTNEYRSYRSYGGGNGAVGRYRNEGYGNGNENEYNSVLNENYENKGENGWSQEEYIP